ncbi:MAG TPA: hypothetical protein VIJ62_08960 [Rhizomicrobium sp.]
MPDDAQEQMSREELLKARALIKKQLSIGSYRPSGAAESARAKLKVILKEIEAELAELETKDV